MRYFEVVVDKFAAPFFFLLKGGEGFQGRKGELGEEGVDGSLGNTGGIGLTGDDGEPGIDGLKGVKGEDAPKGMPYLLHVVCGRMQPAKGSLIRRSSFCSVVTGPLSSGQCLAMLLLRCTRHFLDFERARSCNSRRNIHETWLDSPQGQHAYGKIIGQFQRSCKWCYYTCNCYRDRRGRSPSILNWSPWQLWRCKN